MKTIEISTAVFAAIWAARREGEESENDILSRILGIGHEKMHGQAAAERGRSKVKWIDDIVEAMTALGGQASYGELYKKVREIRAASGRSLPPSTDAIIRREVENHSSASEAYTHKSDLFYPPRGVGAGIWALKRGQH
jgi:Negative regulator of replication initiationR